jgi:outer membrane protein assembly factor BamB
MVAVAALATSPASGSALNAAPSFGASTRAGASTDAGNRKGSAVPLGELTTYGYGNARSDDDPAGPGVTGLSGQAAWDDNLDGAVYGQPLVYGGEVYVGTENDSIYAISATTGNVAWRVHVGSAVSTSVVDSTPTLGNGCGDINPLGITGTPVIDPTSGVVYAAEETYVGGQNWQDVQHWLVAVSLATHKELWHRRVDPPHANDAGAYYVAAEQQRPALTLVDGRVYIEYGGLDGDCGQYHGYVVAVASSGAGPLLSYQVPTQREGAIWGTGGAFVSATGDLYVATGNGSSSSLAHFDEGNAVVELSPTLSRVGYWAPSNWVELNDQDWDLGSAGPVAVPGTSLLFVAGKPAANGSFGYLMKDSPLGGIGKGAFTGAVCPGGGAFGADAAAVLGSGAARRTYVYAPCGSGTEALVVNAAAMTFQRAWSPSTGSPNGPPVVAGGLVWALDWNGGALYGMAPTTGRVEIERPTGSLEHFATPSVADGAVFVPTDQGVEAWRADLG